MWVVREVTVASSTIFAFKCRILRSIWVKYKFHFTIVIKTGLSGFVFTLNPCRHAWTFRPILGIQLTCVLVRSNHKQPPPPPPPPPHTHTHTLLLNMWDRIAQYNTNSIFQLCTPCTVESTIPCSLKVSCMHNNVMAIDFNTLKN